MDSATFADAVPIYPGCCERADVDRPSESPQRESETARARGASRVRVFGSVARGDATEAGDIDFLVDLDEGRELLDLGGLLMDLQELLGHSVDVVTETGMRSRVSRNVLHDAVEL